MATITPADVEIMKQLSPHIPQWVIAVLVLGWGFFNFWKQHAFNIKSDDQNKTLNSLLQILSGMQASQQQQAKSSQETKNILDSLSGQVKDIATIVYKNADDIKELKKIECPPFCEYNKRN